MILRVLSDLPGRDQAREAAQRELSRRPYQQAQPPLLYRLLRWLIDRFNELVDRTSSHVPGGNVGLVLLLLLLALLVALVLVRVRPSRAHKGRDELFGAGSTLSAQQHRARADAAAARGDFADAVRERLRAVVR
ncbi:MAG: hypothetical protein WCD35_15225, partial [Mycobacteriales bacterium]